MQDARSSLYTANNDADLKLLISVSDSDYMITKHISSIKTDFNNFSIFIFIGVNVQFQLIVTKHTSTSP